MHSLTLLWCLSSHLTEFYTSHLGATVPAYQVSARLIECIDFGYFMAFLHLPHSAQYHPINISSSYKIDLLYRPVSPTVSLTLSLHFRLAFRCRPVLRPVTCGSLQVLLPPLWSPFCTEGLRRPGSLSWDSAPPDPHPIRLSEPRSTGCSTNVMMRRNDCDW